MLTYSNNYIQEQFDSNGYEVEPHARGLKANRKNCKQIVVQKDNGHEGLYLFHTDGFMTGFIDEAIDRSRGIK